MRLTTSFAAILMTAAVVPATGAVIGQMTHVGTVAATNGTVDVYHFEITNNTASDIFTFNLLDFEGQFVQSTESTKQGADFPEPAPTFVFADTFVTDDQLEPSAFGSTVDDANNLYFDSVATFGQAWVAAGTIETIAVLSVSTGGPAPVFNGGFAVINAQNQAIVPEPSSLALLGVGALGLIKRRRRV